MHTSQVGLLCIMYAPHHPAASTGRSACMHICMCAHAACLSCSDNIVAAIQQSHIKVIENIHQLLINIPSRKKSCCFGKLHLGNYTYLITCCVHVRELLRPQRHYQRFAVLSAFFIYAAEALGRHFRYIFTYSCHL